MYKRQLPKRSQTQRSLSLHRESAVYSMQTESLLWIMVRFLILVHMMNCWQEVRFTEMYMNHRQVAVEILMRMEVTDNGRKCKTNEWTRWKTVSYTHLVATGSGIKVPVGEKTLGRLFNVTGQTLDSGESLENEEKWVIHREPPAFEDQSPAVEILETGIKVIDLLAPCLLYTSRGV